MATFEVNVVRIDNVEEHPDADRLTIVTIGGYQCIANKKEDGSWRYQKGDLVVYIPEQAVLPEWLLKKMGFWNEEKNKGYLSGSRGNKVKAVKLRGVVSQGVLYPVRKEIKTDHVSFEEYYQSIEYSIWCPTGHKNKHTGEITFGYWKVKLGEDVSKKLRIIKYEPPIPVSMKGQIGNLYGYTKSYDIENFQKYNKTFTDGEDVVITEKLHGTYCQIGFLHVNNVDPKEWEKAKDNKDITKIVDGVWGYVTSKGLAGKGLVQKNTDTNIDNLYMKIFNKLLENGTLKNIAENYSSFSKNFRVYLMGEIFGKGVQDLHYGVQQDPQFRLFDVYIEEFDTPVSQYLDYPALEKFSKDFEIPLVPKLYQGPYSLDIAKQYRDGNDTISGQHIREGIVIRPTMNKYDKKLGRVQLKYISPDYLLRKGGTENN